MLLCLSERETAQAQDFTRFGRNKIQYDNFDFQILKTKNFEIYHYLKNEESRQEVIEILEKWYANYSSLLDFSFSSLQPVIIYANHPDFQQTNVITGIIPEGVGGVTESLANRVILPLTGFHQSTEHVIAHELAHAFLFHMFQSLGFQNLGTQLPLWFVEGMSEYLSLGEKDVLTALWLRDAVLHNRVPSLSTLSRNQSYSPYRFGHAVWAYFAARFGKDRIRPLLDAVKQNGFNSAMQKVFGTKVNELSQHWQEAVRSKYQPLLADKDKAAAIGQKLVTSKSRINIAPALSPNGEFLAFFSQRELFTIDLYLANAKTGKIIKKLVSNDTDAHFDALRFTDSAGTWSPDSRQFAFVVFTEGHNRLAIIDVATLKIEVQPPIETIDAIYGLDWSPGGNRLVFVGLKESITNLYEYELSSKALTPLTSDKYSILHPVWSPDGQTIAFVTDRKNGQPAASREPAGSPSVAGSDLAAACCPHQTTSDQTASGETVERYGSMKIAFLNRADKSIRLLYFKEGVSHTNPQFSPDGRSLFFVSDVLGAPDLYRYSFETSAYYKVTNLATGICGFTLLSPALSVSRDTGRIAFSVFEQRSYQIYLLSAALQAGHPFQWDPDQENERLKHITLPTWEIRSEPLLFPHGGLAAPEDSALQSTTNYFPNFHLVNISQLIAAFSIGSAGFHFAAGANLFWEDLLSDHELFLSFLLSSNLKDTEAALFYRFLKARWDLGILLSHQPLVFTEVNTEETNDNTISVVQRRLFQEKINLLFQYPFSVNRRLELVSGYSYIYYDSIARRVSLTDGILDVEDVAAENVKPPIHLFQNSLAYVGDYSFAGFTAPVSGRRFRYETGLTLGSLYYLTLLGDYRTYLFFRPFTLAFQFLHIGRYLGDAESDYLAPFFLGHPDLVRGYNLYFVGEEVCPDHLPIDECPRFQKLFGSKILTFRTELRLPLLGNSELGLIDYPFLPISLVAFFDAGLAWTDRSAPVWQINRDTDARVPVFSTGLALRINFASFFILQFYLAYPFQSPARGLQFNIFIAPGW